MTLEPGSQQKFSAAERRFEPTVVFVPNFGGSLSSLRRHIEFVNELGFDAVGIHLPHNSWREIAMLPLTADLEFGLRHLWSETIEQTLNAIPNGKILFTFSFPSVAALEALARRNAHDVEAWICDGGPFVELLRCTWNLFTHAHKIRNPALRAAAAAAAPVWLGSANYDSDIATYFKAVPPRFPVLSIRSWRDKLVPASAIDGFFDLQKHVALQTLALPEVDHILGMLQDPENYKFRVGQFLKQVSRSVNGPLAQVGL